AKQTLAVDHDAFAQIMINLVDNAIKFSAQAHEKLIEVSAKAIGEDRVEFAVRDHGPGIARDQMKKIFRLFYRAENELTRETVGTGIGLALVHRLATAMEGEVDVINREPGAEFRVRFAVLGRR
ncbi:MAG: ATP-binding protein, partial [Gammaproteobacteria bacterium]|nr:ATP-binding protein [Gammaproteobacteria bacterium]